MSRKLMNPSGELSARGAVLDARPVQESLDLNGALRATAIAEVRSQGPVGRWLFESKEQRELRGELHAMTIQGVQETRKQAAVYMQACTAAFEQQVNHILRKASVTLSSEESALINELAAKLTAEEAQRKLSFGKRIDDQLARVEEVNHPRLRERLMTSLLDDFDRYIAVSESNLEDFQRLALRRIQA